MTIAPAAKTSRIERVKPSDVATIKKTAAFFVSAFWQDYKAEAVLTSDQINRLGNEQFVDMRNRYGGYGALPSALFIAKDSSDRIVGCVGVEMALINGNKIVQKTQESLSRGLNMSPLIANLAVAPEYRRQGLAKALCLECEEEARVWGWGEMLLLVEAENTPAVRLYKRLGYAETWRDSEAKASKAVEYAGTVALQKIPVTNVAMRKSLITTPRPPGMFGIGVFGL